MVLGDLHCGADARVFWKRSYLESPKSHMLTSSDASKGNSLLISLLLAFESSSATG